MASCGPTKSTFVVIRDTDLKNNETINSKKEKVSKILKKPTIKKLK